MPVERKVIGRTEHFQGTVLELLDWLATRNIDLDGAFLTGTHIKYQSLQTEEEAERGEMYRRQADERTAAWEKAAYARLKAKFEGSEDA